MIDDINFAFGQLQSGPGERYFEWKRDSLKYLPSISMNISGACRFKICQKAQSVEYRQRDSIILLGDCLDGLGGTTRSSQFNTSRAEFSFFTHGWVLCNRAPPIVKRMRWWASTSGAAAANNAESWYMTASLLVGLPSWQRQMLRQLLNLRRQPGQEAVGYNTRSARIILKWLQKFGTKMVWERVLVSISKSAWRERELALDDGAQQLRCIREARISLRWQTYAFLTPQAKRRKTGIQHGSAESQRTFLGNPFLAVWGVH